ncbi:hypothetical protein EIP86_000127 [Pleurotus ostreatoroseus]|nr:hypothetical protein EIP86_000127 [Pleurotus ostreatoroseus]
MDTLTEAASLSYDELDTPRLPLYINGEELTESVLYRYLRAGVPVVATDLRSRFTGKWTPDGFRETHGSQKCVVVDCVEPQEQRTTTVEHFFSNYGLSERTGALATGSGIWKLKDWPPQADFQVVFPELYSDYLQAALLPAFTNPNGVYNLAAHIPHNALKPDLGPKMYNAFASVRDHIYQASTSMHLDICEAVNYLLFSSSGDTGGAEWIIIHRDDTPQLIEYLRKTKHLDESSNPIHCQQYFLTPEEARDIEKQGMRVFIIRQSPGHAVFIPAGCVHQVRELSTLVNSVTNLPVKVSNTADAIKVAGDFLTSASLSTCRDIAAQLRHCRLNSTDRWPDDVLQIDTILYYAYRSLNLFEHDPIMVGTAGSIFASTDDKETTEVNTVGASGLVRSSEVQKQHRDGKARRKSAKNRERKLRKKVAYSAKHHQHLCPLNPREYDSRCIYDRKYRVSGLLDHL